jgi:predicted RNase H-like nuclease
MPERARRGRGPVLPYRLLAGVVPCRGGWLVASAKLQGITMSPEAPQVVRRFIDILDMKPAYEVITVAVSIGLLDRTKRGGRQCDTEARALLGWPRSGAILSPPVRGALTARTYEEARAANGGHLSPVTWGRIRRLQEVDDVIAPYWQRTVYEVHPELSFYQLNDDAPLIHPKHSGEGLKERTDVLTARMKGVARILDDELRGCTLAHRLDASACLWTARRIAARGAHRLPEDPVWDGQGLRMEMVR